MKAQAGAHRQADQPAARRNSSSPRTASWPRRLTPGDVVGIPNHGTLRIGDTLTEGEDLAVPRRAELRAGNPAPDQAPGRDEGEEAARGAASSWPRRASSSSSCPHDGSGAIVGVVGALQLDVLKERLLAEYGLPIDYEPTRFSLCRWVTADDLAELDRFVAAHGSAMARDLDGAPVFMAPNAFMLKYEQDRWPAIRFSDVKDYQKRDDVAPPRH